MSEAQVNLEVRLVEQYVSVLDYVSRCAQAIDGGNWNYLNDKADSLVYAVGRLAEVAAEADKAKQQQRPRGGVVSAAVAFHGRHYRAGRLLHPFKPAHVDLPDPEGG